MQLVSYLCSRYMRSNSYTEISNEKTFLCRLSITQDNQIPTSSEVLRNFYHSGNELLQNQKYKTLHSDLLYLQP